MYGSKQICRLRAVSLLLENPRENTSHARAAKPQVARAAGDERKEKRATRGLRRSSTATFSRGFSSKRETARSLNNLSKYKRMIKLSHLLALEILKNAICVENRAIFPVSHKNVRFPGL